MKQLIFIIAVFAAPLCGATDAVTYQFPSVQSKSQANNKQQLQSDEYWQKVSGKALKNGVELSFTADDPLVRISPKARYENGIKTNAKQLDVDQLQLIRGNGQAITGKDVQHIKQQEMRHAGFADGSVALKLNNMKQEKHMRLKSLEALDDNEEYLVHVKEKHSNKKLEVTGSRKLIGNTLSVDSILIAGKKVNANMLSAKLHSPNNEDIAVRFVPSKGFILNELPEYVGTAQGLLSLELLIIDSEQGETTQRSINVPFFQHLQSASVVTSNIVKSGRSTVLAEVKLAVQEAGRYSVRATLMGSNNNQTFTPIATVESAQALSDDASVVLPFNIATRYKYYQVADIELKDQTRMLLLN